MIENGGEMISDRLPDKFRTTQVLAKGHESGLLLADDLDAGVPVLVRIVPARSCSAELSRYFRYAASKLRTTQLESGILVPEISISRVGRIAFISRPYVLGKTFDEWFVDSIPNMHSFLAVSIDIVRALKTLHMLGIAHENIKGTNFILGTEKVALVDYGITRLSGVLDYKEQNTISPIFGTYADDTARLSAVLLNAFERVSAVDVSTRTLFHQHVNMTLRAVLGRLAGIDGSYNQLSAAVRDLETLREAVRSGSLRGVSVGHDDTRDELTYPTFVARPKEWHKLTIALDNARDLRSQSVWVDGRVGAGKTRLAMQFARWVEAEQNGKIIYLKSTPDVALRPHALIARLVWNLRDNTTIDKDLLDWVDGIAGDDDRQRTPTLDIEVIAREVATSLGRLANSDRPVVVIIDDCQFARQEDTRFLGHVIRSSYLIGRGVLFTLVSRSPEANVSGNALFEPDHVIRVEPLSSSAMRRMLLSMTGKIDNSVVQAVVKWARGSPLLAQNVIRFFIDNGAVVPGPEGWRARRVLPVPPSVLSTRLRSVPIHIRSILRVAAVIGFRGSVDLLARASDTSQIACRQAISELSRHDLLHEDPQGPSTHRTALMFRFSHDTVRDELLTMNTAPPLAIVHGDVARAMVELGDTDAFALAFHLARSGDFASAHPYAIKAARNARNRYSLDTARKYYEIALSARTRYDLLYEMGEVLMLDGSYADALATFKRSVGECPDRNVVAKARVVRLIGETHFKLGELHHAEQYFLQALSMLGERPPRSDYRFAMEVVKELAGWPFGWLSLLRRRFGERDLENTKLKATIYGNLTYCWWFYNSIRGVWAQTREMSAARNCADDSPERAHAYSTHAVICAALVGLTRRAVRYGERACLIRSHHEDKWGDAHAMHLYGVALVVSADYQHGLEFLTTAIDYFDRTGDRWEVNTARWHRAYAMYRLGDADGARIEADRVARSANAIGDRQAATIAHYISILASDGEDANDSPVADVHSDYDSQSFVSYLLGHALKLLGQDEIEAASDVLDQAALEMRRRRMMNAYVAPVVSWRVTVARWRAETSPPGSTSARRWAFHAIRRISIALMIGAAYRTEREHVRHEVRQLGSIVRHSYAPKVRR
ncbi:AAA family ATPase [Haloechinothrix salitolerans]|uniref:AAA family ATPase n=1 Tax=Haloechinothrix salitolerans TaxID=926830 RepID=A0ABW2C4U0_9PSEU